MNKTSTIVGIEPVCELKKMDLPLSRMTRLLALLSGTMQQEANAELKWHSPFPRGAAWTSDYTGWLPSCKGPQFVLEIGMGMDLSLLPTTCLPSISVDRLWEHLIHHCDTYTVSLTVKKVKELLQLTCTHGSHVFLPCAPLPWDSLLNRLLMVCQRFSYRTSWS